MPFSFISFQGLQEAVCFHLTRTTAYLSYLFAGLFHHNLVVVVVFFFFIIVCFLSSSNLQRFWSSWHPTHRSSHWYAILITTVWGGSCQYHRCFRRDTCDRRWEVNLIEIQEPTISVTFSRCLGVWSMLEIPSKVKDKLLQSLCTIYLWTKKNNDNWASLDIGGNTDHIWLASLMLLWST